jgi:hypothetical protein
VLSLRDENDRCCPYGTKYILRAEALIKLALMGLKPRKSKAGGLT